MTRARLAVVVALAAAVIGAIVGVRSCGSSDPVDRPPSEAASADPSVGTGARDAPSARPPRTRVAEPAPPRLDQADPSPDDEAADAAASLTVEVLDDTGALVRAGTLRFVVPLDQYAHDGVRHVLHRTVRPHDLASANPFVWTGLPAEIDGLELELAAVVEGLPPSEPRRLTFRKGDAATVRMVVAQPRTAIVTVVDATTDLPVPGARVTSATELDRRGIAREDARGRPDPGRAVTRDDGRCELTGLGAGEHRVQVHADGYARGDARWRGGDLRVRLAPHAATGSIAVRVLGPDAVPLGGVVVSLVGTDRTETTDPSGLATFAGVDEGPAVVSVDTDVWERVAAPAEWEESYRRIAIVEVVPGETAAASVGAPPSAAATVEARLTDESGAALAGIRLTLVDDSGGSRDATTDAFGNARFDNVSAGSHDAMADVGGGQTWFLEAVEVPQTGSARKMWVLGTLTLRGRVVAGEERRGVEGVSVWLRGAQTAVVRSDAAGRFTVRRILAGAYAVDAETDAAATRAQDVVAPSDQEIVVVLVPYGRVGVRFAAADRPDLLRAAVQVVSWDGVRVLDAGSGDDDLVASKLLPGLYDVVVALDGRTRKFPVLVEAGKTAAVEVRAP